MSDRISPDLRRKIDATAALRQLPVWNVHHVELKPGVWLEGLVLAESGGDFKATRYEAHQDRASRSDRPMDPDTPGQDDGWIEDDKSYGLMQVMGYNIRKLMVLPNSVQVDFGFALEPIVNLSLGCTLLRMELEAVGGDVSRALARYNGGPTGDDGTPMRLQAYVTRVEQHALLALKNRLAIKWPGV